MKLLIITGPLWPRVWNNANLISKLLPYLRQKHELQILSPAFKENENQLPKEMFGIPVSWVTDSHKGLKRTVIYPAASRFAEKCGYEYFVEQVEKDIRDGNITKDMSDNDIVEHIEDTLLSNHAYGAMLVSHIHSM